MSDAARFAAVGRVSRRNGRLPPDINSRPDAADKGSTPILIGGIRYFTENLRRQQTHQ